MNTSDSLLSAVVVSLLAHFLILWPAAIHSRNGDGSALTAILKAPPPVAVVQVRAMSSAYPPAGFSGHHSLTESRRPPMPLSVPAVVLDVAPSIQSLPQRAFTDTTMLPGAIDSAAPGSAEAPSAEGLRSYRLAVASQARRFRQIPSPALTSGWQGTAEVQLDVAGEGRPPGVHLQRSSGHDQLDQAALAMIASAAEHAVLPESLRGKRFAVTLPVVFDPDQQ
jgi:protein TonB